MFCVIQEVEVKTVPAGEPKEIEVSEILKITSSATPLEYLAERLEKGQIRLETVRG